MEIDVRFRGLEPSDALRAQRAVPGPAEGVMNCPHWTAQKEN